ncbi:MAG: PBECR2 nuclease fold domain-containing protein [Chitinivibrionia bacterium]|nr:PBECR2 nuclease fold domain-containing protein [Chitinivibrionia bacterium]
MTKENTNNWRNLGLCDLREERVLIEEQPLILEDHKTLEAAFAVLKKVLLCGSKEKIVFTPIGEVKIQEEYLPHIVEKRLDARERYVNFVFPTLTNPYEIWEIREEFVVKRRYISLFNGKRDFMVIIKYFNDGSVFWNMMHCSRKDMNGHRFGNLIYKKTGDK